MNQADSAMSRSRSQAENESESVDGDIFYHPLKMQRVSMRYPTDETNNFFIQANCYGAFEEGTHIPTVTYLKESRIQGPLDGRLIYDRKLLLSRVY